MIAAVSPPSKTNGEHARVPRDRPAWVPADAKRGTFATE